MHLKFLFNILCMRFFHGENILPGSLKVLWRTNEIHNLKYVDPHKKVCLIVVDLLWWKKSLFYWCLNHASLST